SFPLARRTANCGFSLTCKEDVRTDAPYNRQSAEGTTLADPRFDTVQRMVGPTVASILVRTQQQS
ncbi:MAG: hypothetical protein ACYTFT_13095, partial [Planctomycetota bacterium]